MIVGAAIGAGLAALTDGNIWQGVLTGAIGGMFGVGGNPILAMAGGALGALATGGDPMMGAVTAGIASGVGVCFSESPLPSQFDFIGDEFLKELTVSTACGALAGGVTSTMFGGNFGDGALGGAIGASAGYVIGQTINSFWEDLNAGMGGSTHITYETLDTKGNVHTYHEKWLGDKGLSNNEFEIMLDKVIAKNEHITFFEYVGHGLEGDLFWGENLLQTYHIEKNFKAKILLAFSDKAVIEIQACQSVYQSDSVTHSFKKVLPKSRVMGYAKKAKPYWFPGCGWEAFNWNGRKIRDVQANKDYSRYN